MEFIQDPRCKAFATALVNGENTSNFEPHGEPGQWLLWIICLLDNVVVNSTMSMNDRLLAAMFIYHFYEIRDYDSHFEKALRLGNCANLCKMGQTTNSLKIYDPDYGDVIKEIDVVLLEQHNEKRQCLGMEKVDRLPSREELVQVDHEYQLWLYRPGGDKYLEYEKIVNRLV